MNCIAVVEAILEEAEQAPESDYRDAYVEALKLVLYDLEEADDE